MEAGKEAVKRVYSKFAKDYTWSATLVTLIGVIVIFLMHQRTSGMTKSHATAIVLCTFVLCDLLKHAKRFKRDYLMKDTFNPSFVAKFTNTLMHWTALLVVVYLVLKCFSITDA